MLYFSEIVGKKVYTEDRILVGKLEDLIFLISENPLVTKMLEVQILSSPPRLAW